jgi:hypothetical protein
MRNALLTVLVSAITGNANSAEPYRLNGFLIDEPLISADLIQKGGPPRDGIPAIDSPQFVSAENADFLDPDDRILGLSVGDSSKAYPVRILNRHEVVNDWISEQPVVVTYCPLCGSGVAFSAMISGRESTFGVSGLLYNSDVLLYDRETESLWSQIAGKSVNGALKGADLQQLPLQHTSWQNWRQHHPDTRVLSADTGFPFINYDRDPYAEYRRSNRLWFPVANEDSRLRNKTWVLGVVAGGKAKAYSLRSLKKSDSPIQDRIGEISVTIEFDVKHQTAVALDQDRNYLESIQLYWFAWAAFYPDTLIWSHDDD